jgi:hypothetical protein
VGRQHGPCQGESLGRAPRQGPPRSGPGYAPPRRGREPDRGETRRGRRLTRKRQEPPRDGASARRLLSQVSSARAAAAPLARLDGQRGRIATAGLARPPTLACASKTWGYPQAALLTCCLAFLAYQAVSRLKAALRSPQGRPQGHDEVAGSDRAVAMGRPYDGMMMAMPAPHGARCRERADTACANALRALASSVALLSDQKPPRGPKKKPPERTAYQHGKPVSTAKLLAQR